MRRIGFNRKGWNDGAETTRDGNEGPRKNDDTKGRAQARGSDAWQCNDQRERQKEKECRGPLVEEEGKERWEWRDKRAEINKIGPA